MSKNFLFILLILCLIAWMGPCKSGGDFPGREYMPDMVHSQAFETYTKGPGQREADNQKTNITNYDHVLFADGKVAREPVKGTVARGFKPYPLSNSNEDYEKAAELVNPFAGIAKDSEEMKEAKQLYGIYCAVCHGKKGNGDGQITATSGGPFPPPPAYTSETLLQLPEGKMFHSLNYGKNMMGSYSAQLTKEERWKLVSYVKQLQADFVMKENKLDEKAALAFVRGTGELPEKEEAEEDQTEENEEKSTEEVEQTGEEGTEDHQKGDSDGTDHDSEESEEEGDHH